MCEHKDLGPFELDRVYCMDCLEAMKQMPDKCCVVATDPVWPNTSVDIPGADRPYELFAEVAPEIDRIAYRIIIHLGCDSDPRILSPLKMPFFRNVSLRYARPHYKGRIMYGHDTAYVFGEPPASRPGMHVLPGEHCHHINEPVKYGHPCPRRLSHTQFLVGSYTAETDIVVDPFAGTFTTGAACVRTGRHFIGFEIDPGYHAIAERRIRDEQAQLRLF